MFPVLQGRLQKEVFPQQTVCADVNIVTGIFYHRPKIPCKRWAIGNAGRYTPPFGIEIRSEIAVGQMQTQFMPFVHNVFAGGHIIILEVIVDRISAFGIGFVHFASGILCANSNRWPPFAFLQWADFQVKVTVFLMMSYIAIVVNSFQDGANVCYLYP